MSNRKLAYIVKDQKPLVVGLGATVQQACRLMWERRTGSALIVGSDERLSGIFTGRDTVRFLAKGQNAATAPVADAMTPNPVTIATGSYAIDAIKAMYDGGFRHVPVIEGGKIKGVVSRGDFEGMEFEQFNWDRLHVTTGMEPNRPISTIINNRSPLTLATDETVQRACKLMSESGSGAVLVVDKQQRLKGIFTGRDAMRMAASGKDAADTCLGIVMKPDPVTIAPDGHAIDALRAMSDRGFRHLPVVEDGRICGVVSRSDFTGVEIDRLDEEVHLAECIW